ncbi:uncharacterized protein LOC128728426 [Anopheles nili]|uniref:uncharacterized protein LOC128728426 n=1 Tax=Anopheles nili TaxID=185578 RepID=UPI00237A8C30|nr:uncharacterized protein LOC128728426 [Anopheles nili]
MQQLIGELERKLAAKPPPENRTDLDMTHVLPRRLYGKLSRLVPMPPYDDREFEGILAERLQTPSGDPRDSERRSSEEEEDDDDDDEVATGRSGDAPFEMIVENRSGVRSRAPPPGPIGNWMERFLRRTGHERICWQTKYYRTDRKLLDKPLFQQIEELIDLGAQDFSEWLSGLGAERSNITKDIVKQLFSIEIEDEMARAIRVDTRPIRALPTDVARQWNLEHMAIESRIAQIMQEDRRRWEAAGPPRTVAFGRTLPSELRRGPTKPEEGDTLQPDFPDDLRTMRALFQDIRHLRSVRYLTEHLRAQPDIPRPRYLLEAGLFRPGAGSRTGTPAFYQRVLPRRAIAASVRKS